MERFVPYQLDETELRKAMVRLAAPRAEAVEVDAGSLLDAFHGRNKEWKVAKRKEGEGLPFISVSDRRRSSART